MKIYRLSANGRRTAIILLIGALIIWLFALWTLFNTLASLPGDPSIGTIVPALLMLVLVVATPLVLWNILEEWGSTYEAGLDGLTFRSMGVQLMIPWEDVRALQRLDEDSDEPSDEVLLRNDPSNQIRNPLVRLLHTQAHGRARLLAYAGIEARDELLDAIRRSAALADAPMSAGQTDPGTPA